MDAEGLLLSPGISGEFTSSALASSDILKSQISDDNISEIYTVDFKFHNPVNQNVISRLRS